MRLTRVISRNETPDLIITKPGHLWRQQADVSGGHSLYVIIRFIERSTGRCSTGARTPFTWSRQEELLPLHGGQLARHEGARMFHERSDSREDIPNSCCVVIGGSQNPQPGRVEYRGQYSALVAAEHDDFVGGRAIPYSRRMVAGSCQNPH